MSLPSVLSYVTAFSLLACGSHAQQYECGVVKPPSGSTYITNGNDSPPGAFPWTLDLVGLVNGTVMSYCGAVLIDYSWALTSAQCVENRDISQISVVAGRVNTSDPSGNEQFISVANVTVHPDFDSSNASLPGDLAVLALAERANIDNPSAPINAICLPPSPDTTYWENPSCAISGFGLNQDERRPETMQQAWIDVLRPINCELYWDPENVTFLLPTHQCTFDQVDREVTICQGDKGIPLSCMYNARFELAGTGSFYREECDPRFPAIFSSTPTYLEWIKEITGL